MFDFLFSSDKEKEWQFKLDNARHLYEEEDERRESIDRKLISLQGQIPLFITVIALFYATIFPSIRNISSNYIEGIFFILTAILSGIAIGMSTKMLNPSNYNYMKISPDSLKEESGNMISWQKELVNDYIQSTNHNFEVNNRKVDELIAARKVFIVSVFLGIIMVIKISITIISESLPSLIEICPCLMNVI
ncbi:hypothetical protein LEP1GSC192_0480 [Leptospira sp. B5-022]|nr:hypothetical protein LEP1GSC192_0480 [Leptospira sp. B5-022]